MLGLFLNGEGITAPGPEGERVEDDSFVLLFNASGDDAGFRLPTRRFGARWSVAARHGRARTPSAGAVTASARRRSCA